MVFIDVRCQHCGKLLCQVSDDLLGLVKLKCRHCKKLNTISLATILRQMVDDPVILPFPKASTRAKA